MFPYIRLVKNHLWLTLMIVYLPSFESVSRGAPISNQIHISLHKDLVLYDKEFRQWVITHEIAHEFGFIHEDSYS